VPKAEQPHAQDTAQVITGPGQASAPADGEPALRAFDDAAMPDLLGAPAEPVDVPQAPEAAPVPEPIAQTEQPQPVPIAGGIDAGMDWASCRVIAGSPDIRVAPDAEAGPVEVVADAAVTQFAPQQAVFSGNVLLTQGELQMQADELVLNRETGVADARGNVLLLHPDIRIAGSAASYQLETGQGQIEQASYRIVPMRARGDAEHAELLGEGKSKYSNISYTTCRPGESDWLLSAGALELDQEEGLGTADNATLRFMGVPVLYAPTFTFPIDNRRRSGLLVPSIGSSDSRGLDVSVPYYLNLAENYDLTLTPRLMSKRGLMLGGEFRFLTETTRGELAAEILPDDSEYEGDNSLRGAASLDSFTQFNTRTTGALRLNYVTDDDYLSDLGDSLAVTSVTHLERAGELRYFADTWDLLGRVQYYQTVDEDISPEDRPYSRLPQLLAYLEDPDGISGTSYQLAAEYVNFHRTDSMRGHRITLAPGISLPLRETWGFVEPKLGARYVGYDLTDVDPGIDDSASTFTGLFSLDSGLYFDRSTDWFGNGVTQTLEPRLFYLYVPEEDQDDQAVFDTGVFDFNFDNLFRENRFNGPDRIGDANQMTLALTSRMLSDQSGTELLRASIGQILYFEDREVTLPGETVADDSSSALAAELAARLGGGWYTRGGIQWDPHDGSGNTDQALAQLGYRDDDNRVFNLAYRLRDGVTEQTDVAVYWPVNEQFSLIGRHNYCLQENRLLEALAGIEYGECCWRLRAVARRYTNNSGDDHDTSFLIQLELNGLGRFGDDIDKTLERGIYGYTTD
jgi:LPS-assembly protein